MDTSWDVDTTGLRVLQAVAASGSFTAAARELGYTQSAVSRQVAGLERDAGHALFERHHGGVRPTPAGTVLLRLARVVLDEVEVTRRELSGQAEQPQQLRLGVFANAGATILPAALATLRVRRPGLRVATRDGTSPALVRAVRAGTLDLALVTARPPYRPVDDQLPRLRTHVLGETELLLAVPATSRFAGRATVTADELAAAEWIASPGTGAEPLLGVWPGLPGRPVVVHSARDWLTKLRLVAGGAGVTTVPDSIVGVLPDGVVLVRVEGLPAERRRVLVVHAAGLRSRAVDEVVGALRAAM